MSSYRTSSSHCFNCISVRYATLALSIGYLIMHILGMGFLVYLSLNLDQFKQAFGGNLTRQAKVFTRGIMVMRQREYTERSVSPDMHVKNDTVVRLVEDLDVVNVNLTMWITTLVIKAPSSAMGVPTRNRLNVAIIFCAINTVVAILAICGIMKRLPGCLIPFFLSQGSDVILSMLAAVGLSLNGLSTKEDIISTAVPVGKQEDDEHDMGQDCWSSQTLFIISQICAVTIKLYLLLIIWKCIKHMKDENVRKAREQRQEQWSENILKGQMILDTPPPPAYQTEEETVHMDDLPSYTA